MKGPEALRLQLHAQSRDGLLLVSHHRRRADEKPLGGSTQRQALKDGEPQGCGLGCCQLIGRLLQRQLLLNAEGFDSDSGEAS